MDQKTILKLVNKAKADISSGKLKVADLRQPKTPEQRNMKQALEDYYGSTLQLIQSDESGSLLKAFTDAITTGQTADGFQNSLKRTTWYLTRDASQRQYDTAASTPSAQKDLATRRAQILEAVQNQALSDTGKQIDDATAKAVTEDLLRNNWDNWQNAIPAKLRSRLAGMDVLSFSGNVLNTDTEIRKYAKSMGITIGQEAARGYLQQILGNKMTLDGVRAEIRKKALPYYPQFADRINAGETIEDIASPYRDMIGSMLEVDPNTVNYDVAGGKVDPLLLRAMSGENGKPMGLYDLRKAIKKDSRWQYTKNAQEEYAELTTKLMRMFGAGV